MKTTTDPRPVPGAIDGLPWQVTISPPVKFAPGRRATGTTSFEAHAMTVPSPEDLSADSARWVALHELAHARWTPPNIQPAKVARKHAPAKEVDVQVIEDLRVNSMLARAGLSQQVRRETDASIADTALDWSKAYAEPRLHPRLLEAVACGWIQSAALPRGASQARLDVTKTGEDFRLALRLALGATSTRYLSHTGDGPKPPDPDGLRELFELGARIGAECSEILAGRTGRRRFRHSADIPFKCVGPAAAHLRRCLDAAKEGLNKDAPPGGLRPKARHNPAAEWGTLDTLPPLALSEKSPALHQIRRRISTPAGSRIGSLRRLLTDGRIFRRTVPKPGKGGTVLIDTSGSMSLEASDVHAVLAMLPAATVAIYSGRANHGAVSIIAKDGKCASAPDIRRRISEVGGGNIVDGPALAWLGQQAEPRHWVCDGLVTGCSDTQGTHLTLEAEALRRRGRIRRHDSLRDLTQTLKEGSR